MDLLRHLHFFVTIVEEGHFGRAAARLGIAQPPLSQGLQRLERHLDVVLLERQRGVRLNPAGADLLPRARALLQDAEDLRRLAREHAAAAAAVRIGVLPQLSSPLAVGLVTACRRATGGLVELHTAGTAALVDAVTAGRLDVAVVAHPALLGALRGGPVTAMATALLLPAEHPAVGTDPSRPVDLRALRGLAVATPARTHGPPAHDLLIDTLDRRGLLTAPVVADDDRAALAAVASGRAFALTADPDQHGPGVARRAVRGEPLPLRVRAVWREAPAGTSTDPIPASVLDTIGAVLTSAGQQVPA